MSGVHIPPGMPGRAADEIIAAKNPQPVVGLRSLLILAWIAGFHEGAARVEKYAVEEQS